MSPLFFIYRGLNLNITLYKVCHSHIVYKITVMGTQICTDEILGGSDFHNKEQFWYKVLANISRNKGRYSINLKYLFWFTTIETKHLIENQLHISWKLPTNWRSAKTGSTKALLTSVIAFNGHTASKTHKWPAVPVPSVAKLIYSKTDITRQTSSMLKSRVKRLNAIIIMKNHIRTPLLWNWFFIYIIGKPLIL